MPLLLEPAPLELEAPELVVEPLLEPFVVPLEPPGLEAEEAVELPPRLLEEDALLLEVPTPVLPDDPSVTEVLQPAAAASATTIQESTRPMGPPIRLLAASQSKVCAGTLPS